MGEGSENICDGQENPLSDDTVDLLVIERGNHRLPTTNLNQSPWENTVSLASPKNRPKIIIEAWHSDATLWRFGPTSKITTTRWRDLGYELHCRKVNATHVGGAIEQERLLVVRLKRDCGLKWHWDKLDRDLNVIQPMSNLLIPPGLVPKQAYLRQRSKVPKAQTDPMPPRVGSIIETEKGKWRLTADEVARGLGIPKGAEAKIDSKSLDRTTSLFHWEYLSFSLQRLSNPLNERAQLPQERSH